MPDKDANTINTYKIQALKVIFSLKINMWIKSNIGANMFMVQVKTPLYFPR